MRVSYCCFVPTNTKFAQWLRQEMPRRGYPLEGPRAGGIARLAADAGIGHGSVSRLVAGQTEPSITTLRRIGQLWGYTLGEMLVHAGLAEPEEMTIVQRPPRTEPEPPRTGPDPEDPFAGWPDDLPDDVDPRDVDNPVVYQVLRYVTALPPTQRIILAGEARMIMSEMGRRRNGGTSSRGPGQAKQQHGTG